MAFAQTVSQPTRTRDTLRSSVWTHVTSAELPTGARQYLQFHDPPLLACLTSWLPPFLIQHSIDLRAFISSAVFAKLRRIAGDKAAMDAIYVYAMQLTHNNTAAALLIATTASFDHRLVAIRNPLFNLALPLSDESDAEFRLRISHLPAHLYADSPRTQSGDRDKLQHFFGSAFLTYITESPETGERFGEFIEKGEEAFIIGGANDERDLRADRQGQMFGFTLLTNCKTYPSRFLSFVQTGVAPSPAHIHRSN